MWFFSLTFTWLTHFHFSCLDSVTPPQKSRSSRPTNQMKWPLLTLLLSLIAFRCFFIPSVCPINVHCLVQHYTISNYNAWHLFAEWFSLTKTLRHILWLASFQLKIPSLTWMTQNHALTLPKWSLITVNVPTSYIKRGVSGSWGQKLIPTSLFLW